MTATAANLRRTIAVIRGELDRGVRNKARRRMLELRLARFEARLDVMRKRAMRMIKKEMELEMNATIQKEDRLNA